MGYIILSILGVVVLILAAIVFVPFYLILYRAKKIAATLTIKAPLEKDLVVQLLYDLLVRERPTEGVWGVYIYRTNFSGRKPSMAVQNVRKIESDRIESIVLPANLQEGYELLIVRITTDSAEVVDPKARIKVRHPIVGEMIGYDDIVVEMFRIDSMNGEVNELAPIHKGEPKFARNFLVFADASDQRKITVVMATLGTLDVESHRDLLSAIPSGNALFGRSDLIIGAGRFNNGKVNGWDSFGFNVETPTMIRYLVLRALGTKDE